ncbi:MFS transporter [Raphidocelis subcapitata]|uniref:MFS transporter n=1 Tax=Raphidocelis subcapitata TaxID=307507 RepID=A0A2V0PI94_9CHLO|nr:MFS transporter [Raphidocelis subcapitata]|eukprot:GBF97663.1 MFS transporter [Raphidocelis subcapitata]
MARKSRASPQRQLGSGAGDGVCAAQRSAGLSRRDHTLVIVGLGLGTMIEWYDFQLYSGLSNAISSQFFPTGDPVLQSLSFWGVFALAFVTRPVGAIIFGHVGDRIGRRISLLVSIAAMALPTVIIGCLPSYQVMGLAAPVLLALLRVIQGLAIGGEYGTAVVYAAEIAPPGWEGRHSTFIVAWCQAGLLLGEAMVMLVVAVCAPQQLDLWGWRIPFLLVIISFTLALLLRLNMPEPLEIIARARLAASANAGAEGAEGGTLTPAAAQPRPAIAANGASAGSAAGGDADTSKLSNGSGLTMAAASLAAKLSHRVPLGMLLRHHLLALALFALVAFYAQASVYMVASWLPKHLRDLGVPNLTTQVMYLTALVAKLSAVLATGWAADRGLPICWAGAVNGVVGIGLNFASAAVVNSYKPGGSVAGAWVMQVVLLGWTGFALALLPTVGCNAFPPEVRASGYNLGYSLTSGLVGGLTPLAVTGIRASGSAAAAAYGSAFWTLAAGSVSVLAYVATLHYLPVCNRAAAQPLFSEQLHPKDRVAASQLRSGSFSPAGAAALSPRVSGAG